MTPEFNERTWLAWLVKVRIIVITFLLGIELAIIRLTRTNVPENLFLSVILLWYTIAVFYALLVTLWDDYRMQARLQVFTDLLFATAVVYVTGGIDSYFHIFLFPLVVIVASILMTRTWAYLVAALSFICYGALLELTYVFEVIRPYSVTRPDLKALQATIFINLFGYLLIAYLSSTLAMKLRQVDVQLQDASGALENLQALHENIINSMSGGLITTGLDGHISLLNAPGQRLLERRAGEVFGLPVNRLFLDRLPAVGSFRTHGEVRYQSPGGPEKTFAVTASALTVPERGTIGYVYTFDDLTDIRRLEREVRMRDRLAAVGRMAEGIAHEIKNPLSSIAGSVKALSEHSPLDEEQRTLAEIVTRESQRLNNIINEFLAYSREKGYEFAQHDLLPLLEDTLKLLENRPQPAHAPFRVVRSYGAAAAPAVVDGNRMKQVFWNLCENAVRAMPGGGTLSVSLTPQDGWWQIRFADTGAGISPDKLDKIFEPFQSDFEGGMGLGLAIVYQIVQAHDARISVHSADGQGAEFLLEIKRADLPGEPVAIPQAAGQQVSRG